MLAVCRTLQRCLETNFTEEEFLRHKFNYSVCTVIILIQWIKERNNNLLDELHEESINQKIVHESRFVAHRTHPLWFLLVHLKIQLSIETLEMITSGAATRSVHSHLTQGTSQGNLAWR